MLKRIHAYLIYFILISTSVTAVSFSCYSSTLSASDTAAVARLIIRYIPESVFFNGSPVDLGSGLSVEAEPGDELVYTFSVTNYDGEYKNQVMLKYRINIAMQPHEAVLPLTYTITPSGSNPTDGAGWTYIGYTDAETHTYTLSVKWDEQERNPVYKGQTQTIFVEIDAVQVE